MRRNMRYLALVVLLAIGAGVGVKIYSGWRSENPAEVSKAAEGARSEPMLDLNEQQVASIRIDKAGSANFVPRRQAVGNIDFNQNLLVQVFTPYQGRIINAYPNIGDKVEKDQVLFTIDSPDLLAAESTLIAAAGVLKLENVTLVRAQKMKAFGGASQQAVDQSTSDQMTAEGALKSARDAVRIFGKTDAEIDKIVLERKADPTLVVKSQITGYVTTRSAAPGLFVQPGVAPPPFTVADLSIMWMFANVVESDSPLLLEAKIVLADKAYDADKRVIEPLRAAGKQAVIPSKKNRKEPRPYHRELHKARSLVKIFFCNLKQFRAIATRYDKTARNFLAAIYLASATIWLN